MIDPVISGAVKPISVPRISFADLMETARSLPPEVRADPTRLTITMAVSVIRHFFGRDWCEQHIIQDAEHPRAPGFLRFDFTRGFEGQRKTSRILDFAEMLFNLQHIDGFDDRVRQMRGGQIEATFAEFDFARFLYLHDVPFKFVTPARHRRDRGLQPQAGMRHAQSQRTRRRRDPDRGRARGAVRVRGDAMPEDAETVVRSAMMIAPKQNGDHQRAVVRPG